VIFNETTLISYYFSKNIISICQINVSNFDRSTCL